LYFVHSCRCTCELVCVHSFACTHCTLYFVLCTLYFVLCTLYFVLCTLFTRVRAFICVHSLYFVLLYFVRSCRCTCEFVCVHSLACTHCTLYVVLCTLFTCAGALVNLCACIRVRAILVLRASCFALRTPCPCTLSYFVPRLRMPWIWCLVLRTPHFTSCTRLQMLLVHWHYVLVYSVFSHCVVRTLHWY
jgi:hypothetical protein